MRLIAPPCGGAQGSRLAGPRRDASAGGSLVCRGSAAGLRCGLAVFVAVNCNLDAARRAATDSVDRRLDRQRLRVERQCNDDRGSRAVGVNAIEPRDSSDKRVTAYGPSKYRVALIRLMRRRKNAIRTPDAALHQLCLYSVRLLSHAHPAQFADQPDEFIRLSLLRRNVRKLLLFERH